MQSGTCPLPWPRPTWSNLPLRTPRTWLGLTWALGGCYCAATVRPCRPGAAAACGLAGVRHGKWRRCKAPLSPCPFKPGLSPALPGSARLVFWLHVGFFKELDRSNGAITRVSRYAPSCAQHGSCPGGWCRAYLPLASGYWWGGWRRARRGTCVRGMVVTVRVAAGRALRRFDGIWYGTRWAEFVDCRGYAVQQAG